MEVRIPFMDAVDGVTKNLEYTVAGNCVPCKGSGAAPGSKKTTCTVCRGSGQVSSQLC